MKLYCIPKTHEEKFFEVLEKVVAEIDSSGTDFFSAVGRVMYLQATYRYLPTTYREKPFPFGVGAFTAEIGLQMQDSDDYYTGCARRLLQGRKANAPG